MLNIKIPDYWSPEEALAVLEFLDEIRDAIAAVYGPRLTEALKVQICYDGTGCDAAEEEFDDEIPF